MGPGMGVGGVIEATGVVDITIGGLGELLVLGAVDM